MNDKPQVIRDTDDNARRQARILLRGARFAAIGVIDPETGFPSVSRVLIGMDSDGAPVSMAISRASRRTGSDPMSNPIAPRLMPAGSTYFTTKRSLASPQARISKSGMPSARTRSANPAAALRSTYSA